MPGNPPIPFLQSAPPGWIDPHNWTALGGFVPSQVIPLNPSGDRSGNIDTQAINNALAQGPNVAVWQGPGTFFQNAPYVIGTDSTALIGSGLHVTTNTAATGFSGAAQLIVGPTTKQQNITVDGMQFFGNSTSGHSVQWRGDKSTLRNVILQNSQNDGLHIDANTIGASISDDTFFNVFVTHPGNNGVDTDNKIFDSDFYSVICDGGTTGDTVVGSNIGFHLGGCGNNRFFGCHPFLFANGGVVMDVGSFGIAWIGGECESNAVADMTITGSTTHHIAVTGCQFYDHANAGSPPAQHILISAGANRVDIGQCSYRTDSVAVGTFVTITGANSNGRVHDCPGYNPVGLLSSPPAIAASGTPVTNTTGLDSQVIVTSGAGATSTSISLGGNATGISTTAASTVLPPVRVPATSAITLNYAGGTPTWTWWGD